MSKCLCVLVLFCCLYPVKSTELPDSPRAKRARDKITPLLKKELDSIGLKLGSPIFIRTFKKESLLELWIKKGNQFSLFKSYPICAFSGDLGPKLKEGDNQAPEGFYHVGPKSMNPWSSYHLSFNLGYPNAYDRYHKRTGNYLMVHGECVSIGCFAMGNSAIEEIYTLAYEALNQGQKFFRVHSFPFEMSTQNLKNHESSPWLGFWMNLKTGYDAFEEKFIPPNVTQVNGLYHFTWDK